jgi:hypothetical protein
MVLSHFGSSVEKSCSRSFSVCCSRSCSVSCFRSCSVSRFEMTVSGSGQETYMGWSRQEWSDYFGRFSDSSWGAWAASHFVNRIITSYGRVVSPLWLYDDQAWTDHYSGWSISEWVNWLFERPDC